MTLMIFSESASRARERQRARRCPLRVTTRTPPYLQMVSKTKQLKRMASVTLGTRSSAQWLTHGVRERHRAVLAYRVLNKLEFARLEVSGATADHRQAARGSLPRRRCRPAELEQLGTPTARRRAKCPCPLAFRAGTVLAIV